MSSDPVAPATDVGVIVVTYGSEQVLPAFLASIPLASVGNVTVVIADNSASDVTAELAASAGAEYLSLDNRGYGAAINAAERTLPPSIEWLLISNPDVVVEPHAIDILRKAAAADSQIGAVGPRIVNPDGSVYPSARSVPSLRTGVGHAVFSRIWPRNPWTRAYRRDDDSTNPRRRDAGWLSGACLLVRRSAFQGIEGFDEEYFMYFEDVDFGLRVGRAGYRNVYEPDAVVLHTGAHSTGDSAEMVRVHHRSAARFLDRKYQARILWPLRVTLRAGLAARSALLTRSR